MTEGNGQRLNELRDRLRRTRPRAIVGTIPSLREEIPGREDRLNSKIKLALLLLAVVFMRLVAVSSI